MWYEVVVRYEYVASCNNNDIIIGRLFWVEETKDLF